MNRKNINQKIAFSIFSILSYIIIATLITILLYIIINGIKVVNINFITQMPDDGMTKGGILPAIIGTLSLIIGSSLIAFPIGVLSAIYTIEYAKESFFKRFINIMTNNLAGVPSIVFGLFGMAFFVNTLKFGDSILAGSFTLGCLALPIIIRSTEEALKSIDYSVREASYALGATKLQTIIRIILPASLPNIMTGLILSISRVSGETAPILFTVAAYFLPKLPQSIFDQVMALPYHLYVLTTSGTRIEEAKPMAFGTAFVLIIIVLIFNIIASLIRSYYSNKHKA